MLNEQDFILHIRRLHRLNEPRLIINILRGLTDYSASEQEPDKVEIALKPMADEVQGGMYVMNNGDVFLSLPLGSDSQHRALHDHLQNVVFGAQNEMTARGVVLYKLPADYMPVRERANDYIELATTSDVMGPIRQAEMALQAEEVRGPLTAYSLSQVEKLLDNIDIKRYVRTQPVYKQGEDGVWNKHVIDFFLSVGDLKRERFPRLNLGTPERLFLELCCTLDRRLLLELCAQPDLWRDKKINLNLSAETVLSYAFAQFCHVVTGERRHNVSFEFHRSDLFLNFTTTKNAIAVLKEEGFGVGIDGITPATLPYINFNLLDVAYYKINVTREKWPELIETSARTALEALPRDKVVFSHCDHEEALKFGQRMGIKFYQGWLIDDSVNALG